MNGENLHHTGFRFQTPKRDSAGWQRIIARGCSGYSYDTDCGPEYDCKHQYGCACEECPVGIMSGEVEQAKWENEFQGPPREPGTYYVFGPDGANVATEFAALT